MSAVFARVREAVESTSPAVVYKASLGGPDNMATPHYGLFTGEGECVGNAVRAGYEVHTRDDIIAMGEAAASVFDGEEVAVKCRWKEGHYLTIGPTVARRKEIFGTKDAVFPRFLVRAGYDGRSFSAGLGLKRDACDNLQMLSSVGRQNFVKLRHTRNLREMMPSLVEEFSRLAARWDSVHEIASEMNAKKVVLADYLAKVYPGAGSDSERTKNAALKRIESIVARISRERVSLTGLLGNIDKVTAWEAYQGVQGYCQHDKSRKGRPGREDRAWLALDDKDVEKALRMAVAA